MAAYEQTGKLSNTTHIKGPWSSDMRLAMDWFLTEPSMRKAHYEGRFNPDVFCAVCNFTISLKFNLDKTPFNAS